MSIALTTTEVLTLNTPAEVRALAQKLHDFGGPESEREENKNRKTHIKAKILGGLMRPFHWCIGTIQTLNLTHRINGQHSSDVFLALTDAEWTQVRFPVIVFWEEYTCETKIDLAVLFEQFDPSWSGRSKDDLVGAHLGVHDDLRQRVGRHVATHATAALQWYRETADGEKAAAETQFQLIHANHDVHTFLLWCGQYLSKERTPEMLHPRATLGAIFHCLRDGNPEARMFWQRVAAGKPHNDVDSIEYKLAEFLELCRRCKVSEEWPTPIRRLLKAKQQRPKDRDIFATCLRACAAALKNQKVGEIYTPARNQSVKQLIAELYPRPLPQAA